jgi:prevent-host-death family protein
MTEHAGRTAVYWLYDRRGALLYVGLARDPRARWRQHAETKAWWDSVELREVEWFATLLDAQAAESRSIREDKPIHNFLGSPARGDQLDSLERVGLVEAKVRIHELVDGVAAGGSPVVIARRGQPLAVLVSYAEPAWGSAQ